MKGIGLGSQNLRVLLGKHLLRPPPQIHSLVKIIRRQIIETKRIDHDPGTDPGTNIRTDTEGGPPAPLSQDGEGLLHQGLMAIPGQATLIQVIIAGAPRKQIF